MEGIANLKGRSKVTVETLTTGFTLYEKVALAKREAEKHMEKLDEGYHLLVPHNFSHLLLELYSEPQYVTVKEALFRDHKVVTSIFKGLKILYFINQIQKLCLFQCCQKYSLENLHHQTEITFMPQWNQQE